MSQCVHFPCTPVMLPRVRAAEIRPQESRKTTLRTFRSAAGFPVFFLSSLLRTTHRHVVHRTERASVPMILRRRNNLPAVLDILRKRLLQRLVGSTPAAYTLYALLVLHGLFRGRPLSYRSFFRRKTGGRASGLPFSSLPCGGPEDRILRTAQGSDACL